MQVLIVGAALLAAAIFLGKGIRKYSVILYVLALVVSIASFFLLDQVKIMEMFVHGFVGLALLYIVMIAGALKKKSYLSKKLMTIRKEYSILGFIFLLPHATTYVLELFGDFTQLEHWIGLVAFIIMIPLFYTSFSVIRKKYKFPAWKKLHRWSYLAYSLIFVHLIFVAEDRNLIFYIIIFVPYIILKLLKEYRIYKDKKKK